MESLFFEKNFGDTSNDNTSNVCIIGAGPCGVLMMQNLKKAGIKQTCYERQYKAGGLWIYNPNTGYDENGILVHNSMYEQLWSNGPVEGLELPFHYFDREAGSQPKREQFEKWIDSLVEKNNLTNKVNYNCYVDNVNFKDNKFYISIRDLTDKVNLEKIYTHIIVATGHFSQPNVPEYNGEKSFKGDIIHAHDFRSGKNYKDKDILIIGGSYSAEDIGLQCYKFGSKSVTISQRTKPMNFKWPKHMDERPLLTKIDGNQVYFRDNTQKHFDSIIKCTGYKNYYPFLNEDLRLITENILQPNLQKGVMFPTNHKVFYLGAQDQWQTFTMFNAQTEFITKILKENLKFPEDEVENDIKYWISMMKNAYEKDCFAQIDFQANQVNNLTDICKTKNVESRKYFYDWEHNKFDNILTQRDQKHASIWTNELSILPKISWIDDKN